MHLRSITLKGFKSFPDRTRLTFGPGVSVIVGPNGSGKSNVTDAVLWALGEQSPLAVRGASMQDVIFAGGHGRQAGQAAEVEIVIDNGDGALPLEFSEISIQRRLDRSGEGEYRLNGARCRLVDVLEVLSDTGLGKEMHSVVSQGRVEAIVTSKPRDRRLLIEEAAGLGKHRKRRRRAQLKLARTQENLDRALDVEREARTRLRPLKRQAESAELHERLERQATEARWALARDDLRGRQAALAGAEHAAAGARAARAAIDAELAAVAARREAAEGALTRHGEEREALAARGYRLRSAGERIGFRLESVRATATELAARVERRVAALDALASAAAVPDGEGDEDELVAALEAELAALEADRQAELTRELEDLEGRRAEAAAEVARRDEVAEAGRKQLTAAEAAVEDARAARSAADREADAARREAARVGGELAAANQYLRTHAATRIGGAPALADLLEVTPGFELALAAALGGRLRAAVVSDLPAGEALLAGAAGEAATVLVAGVPPVAPGAPPVAGAEPLLDCVRGDGQAFAAAARLLCDTWVVDSLGDLPTGFTGLAVTRDGRAWSPTAGELRQAPVGGDEAVLAARNGRDALISGSESAAQAEQQAAAALTTAQATVESSDAHRDEAESRLRSALRARDSAAEEERRITWLIEQRRSAPDEGAGGLRRAQIAAELTAQRRLAERLARERAERSARIERERAQLAADRELLPAAERLAGALAAAHEAILEHAAAAAAELDADRRTGESIAIELRACAQAEAEVQGRLRAAGDAVTENEVRAQQARDAAADAEGELRTLAGRLGLDAEPAAEPLADDEREGLHSRVERLARRREQLGPVNPLAKDEYEQAVAHVAELETQRNDLDAAMRELESIVRDTDRQIRESFEQTFSAAARNFEELAQHLFPGGRGRLRLVREDAGPRPVLGGGPAAVGEDEAAADDESAAEAESQPLDEDDTIGVEIEITPAGKSMKRLSLLSGGEKSLTALAFLFAVFLARPCPFYILDEVEAALDDVNIDRFLTLVRRYSQRAQFIVVTHQKRTMDAADWLYGVSMAGDGVSKVVSRRMPPAEAAEAAA